MPEKDLNDYDAQDWASFHNEFGVEVEEDFQLLIEDEEEPFSELLYAGYYD